MQLPPTAISLKRLKQQAKELAKQENIPHTKALEIIARQLHLPNWKALLPRADASRVKGRKIPEVAASFISDDTLGLTEPDRVAASRTEDLPEDTKVLLHQNTALLVSLGIEFAVFEPTETGLKKSILDATSPVRTLFKMEGIHDFSTQGQGEEHKAVKTAYLLTVTSQQASQASLYRPMTKQGDPRMWFKHLPAFASPSDQVAIIVHGQALYLINLSRENLQSELAGGLPALGRPIAGSANSSSQDPGQGQLELSIEPEGQPISPLQRLLREYLANRNDHAERLLALLREIAKRPIPAVKSGDTAVGMAVEAALGIVANSSKSPDFESRIEIKSGRMSKNRSTLFAQVPDWGHSRGSCRSSADILARYGYERGDDFKLYCTVSATKTNSQGLRFECDLASDLLMEKDSSGKVIAAWPGELLRKRLIQKHQETFWIKAKSVIIDGKEHFQLLSVTHTKQPVVARFLDLLNAGVVTMDHLIKKTGGDKPRVTEKGPLFKMDKRDLPLLFPAPRTYDLAS